MGREGRKRSAERTGDWGGKTKTYRQHWLGRGERQRSIERTGGYERRERERTGVGER